MLKDLGRIVLLIVVAGAMLGCTTRLGDFTVLATKNVNLASFNTQKAEGSDIVVGKDTKSMFESLPSMEEATDRALEKANASALTNAVIYFTDFVFGTEFKVKGHPVARD